MLPLHRCLSVPHLFLSRLPPRLNCACLLNLIKNLLNQFLYLPVRHNWLLTNSHKAISTPNHSTSSELVVQLYTLS